MEKWRKYWRRFPVREKISVEETDLHALRRPVRDGIWIEKYGVPNGTPWYVCAPIFYRYHIPNGMTNHKEWNLSFAFSTERCIPNGIQFQPSKSYRLFISNP